MGASLGGKGAMSEINMTPLIDIVLVVLIIMMVNIPIQIERMGVKMPSSIKAPPKTDMPTEQLVLAIYAKDEERDVYPVALNRMLMEEDQLFYEITRRLKPMAKKRVFVDAHPDVPYGKVVDMIDLCREAGAGQTLADIGQFSAEDQAKFDPYFGVGLAKMKESGPLIWNSVAPGSRPRGITVGNPVVVGYMTEIKADKAIKPHKGKILGCYNRALTENPELSGRGMLRINVGPDGKQMEGAKMTSVNLKSDTLKTCIEDEVLPLIEFEPLGPQKTAAVQYPVLFSPG